MENKQVLITGGFGFIGSNLANYLSKNNEVFVIDNGYLGTPNNLQDDVLYSKQSVLEDGLPTDVDVVFHLAALSSYAMHEENPQKGTRVNIEGFVNVVEQARRDDCDTIVYASTSSIYGNQTKPTSEDIEITVNTGYEASKMAREQYAEYFSNHYGLSCAGMRFFSVYEGYGGTEGHKGEYANIISQFADDIANGRTPTLYGDGTQTRDFTHVNDIIQGLIDAAEHELNGIFNLGTGERTDFNTVVKLLNNELGTSVDPEYVENPIPEDVYVKHTCADHEKMTNATGWEPKISLKEGIKEVCKGYKSTNE